MSALYTIEYGDKDQHGVGAVCIGKGEVVGIGTIRYEGTYVEAGGRGRLDVRMTATRDGARLVTGDPLMRGCSVRLSADWPAYFANGKPQVVSVGGREARVSLEKVGDIP